MYCIKLTKEIYINDITEKEAETILKKMIKLESNSVYKTEISTEVTLCI